MIIHVRWSASISCNKMFKAFIVVKRHKLVSRTPQFSHVYSYANLITNCLRQVKRSSRNVKRFPCSTTIERQPAEWTVRERGGVKNATTTKTSIRISADTRGVSSHSSSRVRSVCASPADIHIFQSVPGSRQTHIE